MHQKEVTKRDREGVDPARAVLSERGDNRAVWRASSRGVGKCSFSQTLVGFRCAQ